MGTDSLFASVGEYAMHVLGGGGFAQTGVLI